MIFTVTEIEIQGETVNNVFAKVEKFGFDLTQKTGFISLKVSETRQFKLSYYVEVPIDWKGKPQIQKDLQVALIAKLKQQGIELE